MCARSKITIKKWNPFKILDSIIFDVTIDWNKALAMKWFGRVESILDDAHSAN